MPEIKPYLKILLRTVPGIRQRTVYLRLDMNENPFGLPESFVKWVVRGIEGGLLSAYPEYDGLLKKIASHNLLEVKNICLANGSDAAIKYIFDAYISRGDKVLITEPAFAMYPVYCRMFNALPIIVEYGSDLAFPKKEFLDKIAQGVKMAVIVNPNNPTGVALTRGDLVQIIEKAAAKDVLIVVDEAYFYFYPESVIKEVKKYRNLIVLRTFSKLCAMAGLRLGYAAASAGIIRNLNKVKPSYDVNSLAVLFGERLLAKPRLIRSLINRVNSAKAYMVRELNKARIEYVEGVAGFILIKCSGRAPDIKRELAKRKILVAAGFKQDFLKDYIRVTIGDKKMMRLFWDSFLNIWKNLG